MAGLRSANLSSFEPDQQRVIEDIYKYLGGDYNPRGYLKGGIWDSLEITKRKFGLTFDEVQEDIDILNDEKLPELDTRLSTQEGKMSDLETSLTNAGYALDTLGGNLDTLDSEITTLDSYFDNPSLIPSTYSFFEGIVTEQAWIDALVTNQAWLDNLFTNNAYANRITANDIVSDTITSNEINTTELAASSAWIDEITANNAWIDTIITNNLWTDKLTANELSIDELSALGATIGSWNIGGTTIESLYSGNGLIFDSSVPSIEMPYDGKDSLRISPSAMPGDINYYQTNSLANLSVSIGSGFEGSYAEDTSSWVSVNKSNITAVCLHDIAINVTWSDVESVQVSIIGRYTGETDYEIVSTKAYTYGSSYSSQFVLGNTLDYDEIAVKAVIKLNQKYYSVDVNPTHSIDVTSINLNQQSSSIAINSDGVFQRISSTQIAPFGGAGGSGGSSVISDDTFSYSWKDITGKPFTDLNSDFNVSSGTLSIAGYNPSNWDTAYSERGSQIAGAGLSWSGTDLEFDTSYGPTFASLEITGTGLIRDDLTIGTATTGADLHVYGNIYQDGDAYETHVEQLYTEKDFIISRDGATGGLAADAISGLQVQLADGTNDVVFGVDNAAVARVGWENDTLQAIATRPDSPDDTGIGIWDASQSWYGTSPNLTFDGTTLTSSGLEVNGQSTFSDRVTISESVDNAEFHINAEDPTRSSLIRFQNQGTNLWGIIQNPNGDLRLYNYDVASYVHSFNKDNSVDFGGTVTISDTLTAADATFSGDVTFSTKITSDDYVSGPLGAGTILDNSLASGSFFEVDNLRVRKNFRTHIFTKDQIRATNGLLYVSDASEVAEEKTFGSTDTGVTLDVKAGTGYATFAAGEELEVKNLAPDGSSSNNVELEVTAVDTSNADYTRLTVDVINSGTVYEGDTIVRTSGAAVLIDAVSTYAPYIDALIDGSTKARFGNLDGITNASGNGLWGGNTFLTGSLLAGDLTKAGSYLEYTSGILTAVLDELDITIDSANAISADSSGVNIYAEIFNLESTNAKIGDTSGWLGASDILTYSASSVGLAGFDADATTLTSSANTGFETTGFYLNSSTNQLSLSDTFSVDDGILTAVDAILEGTITATGGDITGRLDIGTDHYIDGGGTSTHDVSFANDIFTVDATEVGLAGFTADSDTISKSIDTSREVIIGDTTGTGFWGFGVTETGGFTSSDKFARIYMSDDTWGYQAYDGTGEIFRIGENATGDPANRIASANFDSTGMWAGGTSTSDPSTKGDASVWLDFENGRIFYDAMGGVIYAKSSEAGYGGTDEADDIGQNYYTTTADDANSNDLTKVQTQHWKRRGINTFVFSGYGYISSIGAGSANIYMRVFDTVGGSTLASDFYTINSETEVAIDFELDVSSITDGTPIVIEVSLRANSGGGPITAYLADNLTVFEST